MNDEAELIRRAKREPEVFGVLYDRYVDRIYRYLLGRTGHQQIAEDLTAETFLAVLKNLWRYRWTGKPLSAWLYRIALAQVGQYYRQERRVKTVALELAEELPELQAGIELPAFGNDYWQLHRALETLTIPQREAITLRYFEDLPVVEIAWVMRLPENTVKSHLYRGLDRLHRALQDQPYGIQRTAQPARSPAPGTSAR